MSYAYTYIMRNSQGLIKVGFSTDPETRRKNIESMSGFTTTLEHTQPGYYLERPTRKKLEQYRGEGEWFNCTLEQAISALDEIKLEYDRRVAINMDAMITASKRPPMSPMPQKDPSDLVGTPLELLTLSSLKSLKLFMLEKLLDEVGGITALSTMLSQHNMTVRDWVKRGQISKRGAQLVEDHPLLSEFYKAIDLRPDL